MTGAGARAKRMLNQLSAMRAMISFKRDFIRVAIGAQSLPVNRFAGLLDAAIRTEITTA